MPRIRKFLIFLLSIILSISPCSTSSAKAYTGFAFVILSQYSADLSIHDELRLLAITSDLSMPTWKSSNSSVASVNSYGLVTAKKAGSAVITAKIKKGEASCRITVRKTQVSISKTSASMERGATLALTAATSNQSPVTWKSSKKSIATVDEKGMVTALKPGETTITASADGSSATCKLTVRKPTISLSKTKVTLYRGQTLKLTATVSSGIRPNWKTNKKSVAIVDDDGVITAIKHGKATITATLDGVEKRCEVTVAQPTISLSKTELTLKKGDRTLLSAAVSSGNLPAWTSSNANVATVDERGLVTAAGKGRAYIYASEDGVKVRCTVYVTE
jgi:uncharacterized protein YjdB